MKRLISLMLALLLAASAGCALPAGGAEEKESPPVSESAPPNSEEASPSAAQGGFDAAEVEGKSTAGTGTIAYDFEVWYPTVESLCQDSRVIVVGEVTDVTYTDEMANAMTYITLKLEEVWESESLKPGDTITIMRRGGYIRGDVFKEYNQKPETDHLTEDDVIIESAYGEPFPETGERYLFFLENYMRDMYSALGGFMGAYIIKGEEAERYLPSPDQYAFSGSGFETEPEPLEKLKTRVADELTKLRKNVVKAISFEQIGKNYRKGYVDEAASIGKDPKKTAKYADYYDELVAFVGETAAKAGRSPRVLILGPDSPLEVCGADTFQANIIELTGGVNVAGDLTNKGLYSEMTVEQIREWNPEYIFLMFDLSFTAAEPLESPEWQGIEAVDRGYVFTPPMNGGAWMFNVTPFHTNVVYGALFVLHYMYPELYSYAQLKEDVMKAYELKWIASNEGYPKRTEESLFEEGWYSEESLRINSAADAAWEAAQ